MRKLLTFLIALGAIVFGVCSPANACLELTGAGQSCNFHTLPSTTTWNPASKGTDQTLSNGNLTVTAGNAGNVNEVVSSIGGHTSGKLYAEVSIVSAFGANVEVGLANSTFPTTGGTFLGNDANGIGYLKDGRVFLNFIQLATLASYAAGNTISVAVDFGNQEIWFRVDNGNWNNSGTANPATNTGGISISTLSSATYFLAAQTFINGDECTANFGATAYAQSVPAGFGNW